MTNVSERIHVNQLGYRPGDDKRVVVHGTGGVFAVLDNRGRTVLEGALSGPLHDAQSGDEVYHGDMTHLPAGGPYLVRTPDSGTSAPFHVSPTVYRDVKNGLLKFFYYQRCGMDLTPEFAGPWAHRACHLDHGTVHDCPGVRLPSAGGWHDAGDYGKYTVAAAKAVADLLLAYERVPTAFADALGIPESGNGVPDVLNEVRYELEWLLKMQRAEDGAVFHKLTTHRFPGLSVMPEDDTAELVFSPVSYTAAGTFAAAMAMAARVYRPVDSAFADTCLYAAEKSWSWLTVCTDLCGFRNPADILTGEYGDQSVLDEKYWAAAELYRTTCAPRYQQALLNTLQSATFSRTELGWAEVGGYGTIAYLSIDVKDTDATVRQLLLDQWRKVADHLLLQTQQDGYGISLQPSEYIWGSTMVLLNQAMHAILASEWTGDDRYLAVARHNFDYLLGLNPLNQCYVSGFGAKPLLHPHHRPSVGDGVDSPVPGMVAGGPNRNLQDEAAQEHLTGQPPARCFIDHEDSYSTNEVTIYWNSPAVFVAAYLDAVPQKGAFTQ